VFEDPLASTLPKDHDPLDENRIITVGISLRRLFAGLLAHHVGAFG
jgi:hypothetical protein